MKLSINDYKGVQIPANLLSLYFARLLISTAFGVVGIFLPIFFYIKYGESIIKVILIFIIIFILYGMLVPFGAMFIQRLGIKNMMIMAVPFALFSTLSLFIWDLNPVLSVLGYMGFILVYKIFYWTPYHIDFAKFTSSAVRGRQMSFLRNLSEIVSVVTPVIGGMGILYFGFNGIFGLSSVIFLFAIIPLLFINKTSEKYTFGYFETYKKLFSKENRPLLFAYGGDGLQDAVSAVIWPIFIFILLEGGYLKVGIVTSVTILVIIILRFIIGDLIDKWSKKKITAIGVIIYTTGWIAKIFIETGFQIFLIDTYHNTGKVVNKMSFDASTYEQAADNGHYIDEFTVLKEIALYFGRATMLIVAGFLIILFNIKVAFVIAAVGSLFMVMVNKKMEIR